MEHVKKDYGPKPMSVLSLFGQPKVRESIDRALEKAQVEYIEHTENHKHLAKGAKSTVTIKVTIACEKVTDAGSVITTVMVATPKVTTPSPPGASYSGSVHGGDGRKKPRLYLDAPTGGWDGWKPNQLPLPTMEALALREEQPDFAGMREAEFENTGVMAVPDADDTVFGRCLRDQETEEVDEVAESEGNL